jgi:hypothetical protein
VGAQKNIMPKHCTAPSNDSRQSKYLKVGRNDRMRS